ncbi:MAG TPA: ATP-binding protein [Methanocorpusculum sp.]|nr:ATP-binding protein [Methanocorpusculum sp.]
MLISREGYLQKLLQKKDKDIIKIITGVRRCGKSTLLFQLYYQKLLDLGVPKDHIIRIALDNIRFEKLTDVHALYRYVKKQIKDDGRYYLFIDEIQLADRFEDAVNGIKNDFNVDIYITGSNSKFLSKDINTTFRGRGIEIHVMPLSFAEYYSHTGGDKRKAFNEYLLYGGMPYCLQLDSAGEKAEYLAMMNETVVLNDIIERYHIRNAAAFGAVVSLVLSSVGSYVSAKKIADTLQSSQTPVDHKTVSCYLDYLCDAFLFYRAVRFDLRGKAYLKTLHKYYACDMGMRNSALGFRQIEPTHAIENLVYLELKRRGFMVDIGINRDKEIDFVARSPVNLYYIQVSYSVIDPCVLECEASAFRGLDDGYQKIILTMDEDLFVLLEGGYRKMNLIDFLLDEKALQ